MNSLKLVLAEKPSVAMSIAKVIGANSRHDGYTEGNGYVVSWCVGHLVELAAPEDYDDKYKKWSRETLPILPQVWKYLVSPATKKQFDVIKSLMKREDISSLVCATDAGREGELIFRLVYHQAGCKKPFERLWISSMEDTAIREGFQNLRPSAEYDNLYAAALCRERADWLVGMNGTRLFSTMYGSRNGKPLSVGRVQTPTLAMVVMRDAAIRGFTAEPFFTVQLKSDGFSAASERMKEKSEAEALARQCREAGQTAVTKVDRKEKSEKPPLLYDLTTLQRDANRQHGFTAQQTLDYTQSLYEKKLVTYPRTDSRYLTDDMEGMVPELVRSVQTAFSIVPEQTAPVNAAQVINSKKVTDHHAIIPTKTAVGFDVSQLPSGEQKVLQMIARRLICAVGVPCRYSETQVELTCADRTFSAKGKTVLDSGWRTFEQQKPTKSEKGADEQQDDLPQFATGDILSLRDVTVKEGQTTPPKHYTEDTLLSAMEAAGADEIPDEAERKGIGTPATRAGIIEGLVQRDYIERRGDKKTKYLCATEKGFALITVVPEELQSPLLTADWEQKLLEVSHGDCAAETFMAEISDMVSNLVADTKPVKGADVLLPAGDKVIGACPACGKPVVERPKSWSCSNKECKFVVWKTDLWFKANGKDTISPQIAEKLIKKGEAPVKGFRSKRTGKNFDATVVMEVSEDGSHKFSFRFDNKK